MLPDTDALDTCVQCVTAYGESSAIWVRDSDRIIDRVKVRVTSVVLVTARVRLGLDTLLDIDTPDAIYPRSAVIVRKLLLNCLSVCLFSIALATVPSRRNPVKKN